MLGPTAQGWSEIVSQTEMHLCQLHVKDIFLSLWQARGMGYWLRCETIFVNSEGSECLNIRLRKDDFRVIEVSSP